MTLLMPPIRKKAPMARAKSIFWLRAMSAAIKAPLNVPNACAKKGMIKCFG